MTDTPPSNESPSAPATQPDNAEPRYLLLVGGLLVLIIALLAFLWLQERGRRQRAQTNLQAAQAKLKKVQAVLGLPGGLASDAEAARRFLRGAAGARGGGADGVAPVDRADLPAERGQLNGHPVTVLRLGAAGAKRLGFEPGDVIVVSEPLPKQPAQMTNNDTHIPDP